MALFRKGPPNVDKLKAKGDVRGLLQAVAYEEPSDAPASARVNRPVPGAATMALYQLAPELDATAVEPLGRVLGDSVAVAVGAPDPVLGHGQPAVRRCAAALLAGIGEPAARTLAADLADYDEGVRGEVMRGLRSIGRPAVAPVTELLHADDWGVRAHAAEALGVIGDPAAVDALAEVLANESDGYVRRYAVVALGEIGDPRVIEPLTAALDDDYESARQNAKLFLDRIAAQTPGTSTALPEIGAEVLPTDFVPVADDAGPGRARFDEAIAAWNGHDMDRSAQLFTEALEAGLDPTFACGAEASLGQIRLDEGDLQGGVEHLLRCLRTRPITAGQAWEAAVRLQIVYDTAGRRDEARRLGDVAANANRRGLALSGEAEDRLRHLVTAQSG